MTLAVLIVAAGRGTRAGGDVPKQWQSIQGKPVLMWTLDRFRSVADHIAVVLHPDDLRQWDDMGANADVVVTGGATRDASVRAGLEALRHLKPSNVLIHDAARPLTTREVINSVIDALNHSDGAAPALEVTDALWTGKDGMVSGAHDRNGLFRAQTPQGFNFKSILHAHRERSTVAADDVEVARDAGLKVTIVKGDDRNFKITTPEDFARAEKELETSMDIRLGNGFDVHRFGDGDHVWLCGVKVPFDRSLQGHSDADVGMHAITDAIYGALGAGDIGVHFPPSDPQWKGAASHIFLRHAVALANENDFQISNVDCTLICEFPKIGPHQSEMKAALSEIMSLDASRISVKATTSERLGFTGRGEGIACIATVTLMKK